MVREDEILAALAIQNVPGIGPIYAKRLLDSAGDFQKIFDGHLSSEAEGDIGIPASYMARVQAHKKAAFEKAEKQVRAARSAEGVRLVILTDTAYPGRLREIADPPTVLYIYGEVKAADELSLGVVGTRKATAAGLKFAHEIGYELASIGIAVVSGLAMGVDAAAHQGALEAEGGRTLAVLGSGVDVCYPTGNRHIYERIRNGGRGALISEFAPGTQPQAHHFPMRNRIISGIGLGVIVVEAPQRSGALITARMALEQGRDVFAVPHSARSAAGAGSNRLIRDGAHLVEKVEDILGVIEHQAKLLRARDSRSPSASAGTDPAHVREKEGRASKIYDLIEQGVGGLDDLVNSTGQPVSAILAELTRLEIEGRIRRAASGTFESFRRKSGVTA